MRTKLTTHDGKAARSSIVLGLLTLSFLSFTFSSFGQASRLVSPDLINWTTGPAKADLGPHAEIRIPSGFSFVSGADAVTVLKIMNSPTPPTLVGVLTPASRRYLIVLEYNSVGYVKNAARQKINSAAVLKFLNKGNLESSNTAIQSIAWHIEPKFDRDQSLLEWAILARTEAHKIVNHVVRQLGREGMLDAVAVQPAGSNESVPLKQIMAGITFKPGYAYADYQEGDRLAERNLAELIAGETSPELKLMASNNTTYAVGGGAFVLLGAGILMVRRKKSSPAPKRSTEPLAFFTNQNGNGAAHNGLLTNGANGVSLRNGTNGDAKLRRRRVFDYQRYYTDLMSQVSDRAESIAVPMPRRRTNIPIRAETQTPAKSNGIVAAEPEFHSTNVVANIGLIESQKRLIEEQQRLIREQTKLIEEKTRLIHEKNQVLDKQSELFGNNVFDH
jgi:uncharacterized membrane-anchored protein